MVVLLLVLILVLRMGRGIFDFRLDDSGAGGQTALLGEDRKEHSGVVLGPEVGEWVGLRLLGCRCQNNRSGSVS